jgi:hypothetical protein
VAGRFTRKSELAGHCHLRSRAAVGVSLQVLGEQRGEVVTLGVRHAGAAEATGVEAELRERP